MLQAPNQESDNASAASIPWQFFVGVFVLSMPFWLAGAVANRQLHAGLPLSALMFICPMLTALILRYRQDGRAGARALLERAFDFGRAKQKAWYAVAFLLMPAVMLLSFFVLRLTGLRLPAPNFSPSRILALCALFLLAALCEELGWSGYATDPMQKRWGPLVASLWLGLIWALWHYIPLLQAHRSLTWITWWTLFTVASRVVIVWLYDKAGRSVLSATVFHATLNVSWLSFPIDGSLFDPRVTGIILAIIAVSLAVFWPTPVVTRRTGDPIVLN